MLYFNRGYEGSHTLLRGNTKIPQSDSLTDKIKMPSHQYRRLFMSGKNLDTHLLVKIVVANGGTVTNYGTTQLLKDWLKAIGG